MPAPWVVLQEGLEPLGQTGSQGDLAAGVGDRRVAAGLLEAEAEEGSEASRGVVQIQFGLPRPASRNWATSSRSATLASLISSSFSSNGLEFK